MSNNNEVVYMKQVFFTNSINEYMNDLVNRYGFSYVQDGNITTLTASSKIGNGYIKIIQVSDDIEIGIIDLFLRQPIITYYDDYPNTCEAIYCFSGHISYLETNIAKAYLNKHEMGLYALPRSRGMTIIPSNERVITASIISKISFHRRLPYSEQCTKCSNSEVRDLLFNLTKPKKPGAKIHNYFKEIVDNDIGKEMKNVYLDSLGKILLSDLWQENIILPLTGQKRIAYSAFEKKALLEAKKILSANYYSPPTIHELSKMVVLNEYKLKTAFRDMYGKSIYKYIRSLRMKNARHLLENMDLSISEIAGMVGYVNTSHFAAAFRNEYGLNPSDFRFGA